MPYLNFDFIRFFSSDFFDGSGATILQNAAASAAGAKSSGKQLFLPAWGFREQKCKKVNFEKNVTHFEKIFYVVHTFVTFYEWLRAQINTHTLQIL